MSRDYTGQRFNKLVVLSVAEPYIDKSGRRVKQYKCLCDCGNTRVVATSNLLNGNTKSCGCYRVPYKMMNLVGQAFGKLTVIAEGERHKDKHRVWICRCECGNVKSFLHSNLVKKDFIVPRGSPMVSAIAENEYCCCLRDRTTSFSARVISRFLRSEDHHPHNSLEKSRPIGPPKNSKSGSACPHVLYVNNPYIAFQMISGIIYKGDCLSPMRLPPKGANT